MLCAILLLNTILNNVLNMPIIIQLFIIMVVGMSIYGGYLYIKRDDMFMDLVINFVKNILYAKR